MKKIIIITLVSLTSFIACTNDQVVKEENGSAVIFKTFVGIQSKGAAASQDANSNLQQNFGVFVYQNATGIANSTTPPNTLYNEEVRFVTGNTFEYDNIIYWPASNKLGFYAYSPYSSGSENGISGFFPANITTPGVPGFQYVVNADVNNQIDLLVAKSEGRNGGTVPLAFLHALSRVEVQASTSGENYRVAITNVELSGINSTGTYNFTNTAQPWSGQSAETQYTALLSTNGTAIPGGLGGAAVVVLFDSNTDNYTQVTLTDNAMYLLPQALGANARMTITYNIYNAQTGNLISNSTAETVSIDLSDPDATLSGLVEWGKNKRVIYKLNFAPQPSGPGSVVKFEATVKDWDIDNGVFS